MQRCSAEVCAGWRSWTCRHPPKVERNGKSYCGIHDPVRLKERAAKRGPSKFQREIEQMHRDAEELKRLKACEEALRVLVERAETHQTCLVYLSDLQAWKLLLTPKEKDNA